jgi:hypothetical protein
MGTALLTLLTALAIPLPLPSIMGNIAAVQQ